jgi:hypothetical protein
MGIELIKIADFAYPFKMRERHARRGFWVVGPELTWATGYLRGAQFAVESDFWNRPPLRPQGDSDPRLTQQAVGYALSQWEHADQNLASLFSVMAGSKDAVSFNVTRRAWFNRK